MVVPVVAGRAWRHRACGHAARNSVRATPRNSAIAQLGRDAEGLDDQSPLAIFSLFVWRSGWLPATLPLFKPDLTSSAAAKRGRMSDPFATRSFVRKDPEGGRPSAGTRPDHIGRYRVERQLGEGGFGLVYLAYDEQLRRPVAIKVPHARHVAHAGAAAAYLTEARTVANLDHRHIVPVFDIGSTEQFPYFVVSKYIDGTDLAAKQKQAPLLLHEAVSLVATVAEALHYAHKQGLTHRDVKPSNILLDHSGEPFVADFGLALRAGCRQGTRLRWHARLHESGTSPRRRRSRRRP